MNNLQELYQQKITSNSNTIHLIKNKLLYVSISRMFAFLLLAFSAYQLLLHFQLVWLFTFLGSIIAFLALISWFIQLKNKEKYLIQLSIVYQNEIDCLNGKMNMFNNGSEFASGESFWDDLDIFQQGGLFHLINRSSTHYGLNALANKLQYPLLNKAVILEEQIVIQTLSKQIPLIESIITTSLLYKTDYASLDAIFLWLNSANQLHKSVWIKFVRYAFPMMNIGLICYALITGNISFFGISFLLGIAQIGYYFKYIQENFGLLSNKEAILKQYAEILKLFSTIQAADSAVLNGYKENANQAYTAILSLSKISNRIDQRLNILIMTFFNPYFLYDIQNMWALEDWKIKYQHSLQKWMDTVAAIERYNSLAVYAYQNSENIYPSILDKELAIQATGLAHPLIQKQNRVSNNITIGQPEKLLLITGSNMSGKTTFLRTLGVNLVMAQNGLPVCATAFSFLPMNIFTSIRISDSLQENTSYFMAELKKLQALKKGVKNSSASLVLIDEILRGTNSDDKYYGSEQFVKELIQFNCISLFATHDLKLSELETEYPNQIANYCFESSIVNEKLLFDYTIRKGVAQNKNASFLMKQMGII
jgi:DNA mismatch repair ATPase MutS